MGKELCKIEHVHGRMKKLGKLLYIKNVVTLLVRASDVIIIGRVSVANGSTSRMVEVEIEIVLLVMRVI